MSNSRVTTLDKLLSYLETFNAPAVAPLTEYLRIEAITTVHPRFATELSRMLVFMSTSGIGWSYSGALSSLRRLYKRSPVWLDTYIELLDRGLLVEQPSIGGVTVNATQALTHLIHTLGDKS